MRASRNVVEGYIKLGTVVTLALACVVLISLAVHRLWADLPAEQWSSANLGGGSVSGSSSYNSTTDTFTIQAVGQGIKGFADSGYFVYQTAQGNVEITARVGALQNTTPHATAGVMLRESTAAEAQSVYLSISPDKGITQTTRSYTGSVSSVLNGPAMMAPVWLKLVRSGGAPGVSAPASYTLSSYYSSNGVSWTLVGSQTLTMAGAVQMGLALASQDATAVSTVTMDGVSALTHVPQPGNGLVLWLRGDAGLAMDGSNRVSLWEDQSGLGNHATQPTAPYSPILLMSALNRLPALRFTSANSTQLSVTNSASLNPTSGKVSVIAVARRTSETAVARIVSKYTGSNPSSGYLVDFTSATAVRSWIGGNTASRGLEMNTYGVVESVYDQSLNKIYINGASPDATPYSTAVASNTASLGIGGDGGGGNFLTGEIAEVLVFNKALSDSEREDIEIYLYRKYGVGTQPTVPTPSISVPSGTYTSSQTVTLSVPTGTGISIYYTLNGQDPTTSSTLYTGGAILVSSTTTIKAIAVKDGYQNSGVVTSVITVDLISGAVTLNGLALWLRADMGVVTNSGKVTQWVDQSGNGHDAIQTTSANQPSYQAGVQGVLNGLPAIRFTSANRTMMTLTNSSGMNWSQLSMILVFKRAVSSSWARLISKFTSTYDAYGYTLESSGGSQVDLWLGGLSPRGLAAAITPDTYTIFAGTYNQSQYQLFINGTAAGSFSNSAAILPSSTPVCLGADYNGVYYLDGDLVEILMYNRGITATERQAIETYLNQKYFGAPLPRVATPTISVSTGTYTSSQAVTLSGVIGATVHYTLDGSTPGMNSPSFSGTFSTTITSSTTIKAMAVQSGYSNSEVATSVITLDLGAVNVEKNGLVVWLRGDAGVTTNGNAVTQWLDQSGNNNHALQSNASKQPSLVTGTLNGRPVVRFNSANSTLLTISNSALLNPASGQVSMLAVVQRNPAAGTARVLSKTNGSNGYALDFVSAGSVRSWLNGSNAVTGTLTLSTYGVVSAIYDQSLNKIWINGGTPVVNTYSTAIVSNTASVGIGGDSAGGSNLDGDIAEVLIYNRALTNAERQKVEIYLYEKYGIGTVPVTNTAVVFEINRPSGTYGMAQTVTLSLRTGTTVYYTLDGTTPTRDSLQYMAGEEIVIGTSTVLKIRAALDGSALSDVVTRTYVIDPSTSDVTRSGMLFWLRADAGVATNSGNVTRWDDQSGNGYAALQTSTSNQPLLVNGVLNGRPVIRFSSANATALSISNSGALNPSTGKVSLLTVTRRTGGTALARILSKSSGSAGYALGFSSGTTASSTINGDVVESPLLLDSYGLVESVYDQSQNQIAVLGKPGTSTSYSAPIASNTVDIGIGAEANGSNALDGEIAEIVVYDGVLTSTQSTAVREYLKQRYGMGIAQEKLAAPSMEVATELHGTQQMVTMSGPVGAVIHFSFDGNAPTASSATYLAPIVIGSNTVLQAVAIQDGYRDSDVVSKTLVIDPSTLNVAKDGLALWLRGDVGITSDVSGKVSRWQDQSGQGNHAVQTATANQPLAVTDAVNTKPAVRFNSGSNSTVLSVADSASLNATQSGTLAGTVSLIAVVKRTTGTTTARVIAKTSGSDGYALDFTSATAVRSWINRTNAAATTLTTNTYGVVETIYNKSLNKIWVNSATPVVNTYSASVGNNAISVGIGGDSSLSNALDGEIAEVLMFNRALTESERQDLDAYLYQRYNLGIKPTVTAPTISVPTGTYAAGQNVVLTGPAGTTLYFTTDGSDPTTSSAVYTSPFAVNQTTTIKVLAVKNGYQNSGITTSVVTINSGGGGNPADVTLNGLALWLRADMGVTLDGNGKVSRWEDQSGSGNHAVQTATASRPLYMSSVAGLNNMPTLAFTQGPNTYLQIAHNASLNPASQSAIIVLKRDSDNTSEIISKFVGDGGIYYGYVTEWYAGSYRMYWNNGNSDYIATNTSIGQYAILETVYNQQTMRNYVNGVLSGSINKTYALGANSVPLYIAGSYYGLNGHIAEVLLYNRGITDLERQAIEVYLYQKYGVGNIQTATAPTITLTSGESGAQQYATLSAATGASIYYTLDGNTPTTGSALYAGQFSITTSCTLKAIAVESGKAISSVTSRTILIDPSAAAVPMSGMAVWLRADVGVTKDANSKVSVWQDQSGGGHDASMTNTTAQPVWMASVVNGRPVVRFDGVNDYLTTSYNWPGGTELSLFVVTKGGNYQSLIRAQDGDYVVYPWSNGATFILSSDGGTGNGVSSGLVASEWNLGSAIYKTGETMSTYRNGTLVGSRTAGTNTLPSKPLMIGSYLGSSEFLNADVAEVILYNRALSTQERQNVEAYLTHKYLDADSDGNGISDTWEMQYFGRVGVNADGDEDKDGLTNLQEYQQGSDPTQYYNGLTPTLRIVSGDGQTAPSGSYAPQALSVQVVNASNQILSNAPIRFRVTSTVSDGKLSRVGAMGAVTADAIDLKTQIDGYGTVYAKLPITVADMTIEASAVGISATPVTFTLHANSGTVATPSITADLDYFSITRTLTIACATSGADIRYTLDGNAPTLSSATVANGGTVTTTGRTLIRVKAFKTGYTPSGEKTMLLVSQPNLLQLAAHGHYSMIKNAAGEVWNWGDNSCGQLGQAVGITSQSTPIQLGNPAKAALITVGDYHAAGILSTTNSSAWSVGANWFGQLGDGTATSTSSAVAVQTLTSVTAIAAGEYHTLAVTSDKTVWAWGVNWYGGLGDGTNSQRTSPVLITNLTNVSAIAAGGVHSLALKGDGTVWAWGGNLYGQLGLGTTTDRNTPAQISALNSITAIASGSVHNLALRSDGTVWAWGSNDYGQLGDGTTTQRIVPVQVMINATTALSGVRSIAVGRSHSFAITSDGKLWVWGYNGTGQLGNNTTTNQPYAITLTAPTLFTNVVLVAGGYNHSLAMTADGAVWAWGDNSLGQLGTGDTTNHLVPTKIDFATDSDGDGLSDLYEIIHGYDPLAVDSNGDGIGDAASEAMGIDPTNPDVDGDGISNEQELLRGTNPLVKEIAPVATPGDTEAPVILLHRPVNATPQTPQP